jgi:hypothetical protein
MHTAKVVTGRTGSGLIAWLARGSAIFCLAILSWFVIAHLMEGGPSPTAQEWIGIACFPVGVMAGLSIGLVRPKWGAIGVIASLMAFYVWYFVTAGTVASGPYFLLLSSPALLFVLQGWFTNRTYQSVDRANGG